jgi:hypothetical protein
VRGYLSIFLEFNNIIEKLKIANVIIIDEMSMMTGNILCAMEQRLKQAMSIAKTSPFQTKLVLLVGDLAQLPPICKHTLQQNDILCKSYHVKSTPGWKMAQQHFLSILMCHGTNLKYLQFLNIIQEKKTNHKGNSKSFITMFFANSRNKLSH